MRVRVGDVTCAFEAGDTLRSVGIDRPTVHVFTRMLFPFFFFMVLSSGKMAS